MRFDLDTGAKSEPRNTMQVMETVTRDLAVVHASVSDIAAYSGTPVDSRREMALGLAALEECMRQWAECSAHVRAGMEARRVR